MHVLNLNFSIGGNTEEVMKQITLLFRGSMCTLFRLQIPTSVRFIWITDTNSRLCSAVAFSMLFVVAAVKCGDVKIISPSALLH